MKKWSYRITLGILFCCLAAVLPALAQDNHPQSNAHPEHQEQAQKPAHQAQRPAAKPHTAAHPAARPQPAQHNAARPQQRNAAHPQPQNHTNARPAPGNAHPQQQPNRRPSPTRAQQQRPNQRPNHGRPAQWGRPPAHRGSYSFRSNDRARLHSYYMSRLRAINRANRPVFRVGGYFPYADIGYLSPLPPDLYGALPPPPLGYQMGYYDGYVVVYDPMTYFIASVIDLLQ